MKFDSFYSKIIEKDEHKRSKEYKKLTPKMKKAVDEIFNKMEMLTLPNLGEFDEHKEVTFYSSKKDLSVKGQTQIIDPCIG